MNREKAAWMISVVLIAMLAFQLPGTLAQRDDDYTFVRRLVDIHRHVVDNYVEPVNEDNLRDAAIDGMLSELDPYSIYVPPAEQERFDRMLEGSFKGVGIQLNQNPETGLVEVVTPIDESPAFEAGVLAGDIILKVNGESIEGERLEDIIKRIAGPLGSEVTLTVRHLTGETEDLTMHRAEISVPTVKGFSRKLDNTWNYYAVQDPKIAYLRITQFTPDTFAKVKEALDHLLADGMRGLILDLRFNPGGRLDQAKEIVDLFIDSGVIVVTRGRNRPEEITRATAAETLPEFPMIVLVNEHSASASEIVAGSLKDNRRALVIGTRTYGKGSVQELIPLEGKGGELKLTVAYYYLPSGRLVHRKKDATDWGVEPHIVVPMDPTAQRLAVQARAENENHHRPVIESATRPSTAPATQPVDAQLQRSVDTMLALLVLGGDRDEAPATPLPSTGESIAPRGRVVPESPDSTAPVPMPLPATQPASQPSAPEIESGSSVVSPEADPIVIPDADEQVDESPATAPATVPVSPAVGDEP